MELAIILVVLGIIGLFVWRSYTAGKKPEPRKRNDPGASNTDAAASSKRF